MKAKTALALLTGLWFALSVNGAVAHPPAARPAARAAPRAVARPAGYGGRPGVARAQYRGRAGYGRRGFAGHRFAGRDFRHFSPRDRALWRRGAWHREFHDGRYGWWWFAGGAWYFYAQPVYPYPVVVSQVVYGEPEAAAPVVEAAPVVLAPAPRFRYYCDNPAGYYPAVADCPTAFRKVPVP